MFICLQLAKKALQALKVPRRCFYVNDPQSKSYLHDLRSVPGNLNTRTLGNADLSRNSHLSAVITLEIRIPLDLGHQFATNKQRLKAIKVGALRIKFSGRLCLIDDTLTCP